MSDSATHSAERRDAPVEAIFCPNCRRPNGSHARFCQYCGSDMILNNDRPTSPRRYVITRVIKEGGQGAIYEGVDQNGYVYAIKEMLDRFTDPAERDDAIRRFDSEAALLQRLNHPRIPRIYSHFIDEGRYYLTMDFIRGEDLNQRVERLGALPEAQVLVWADQICDVLHYLHENGLIYRDMKPANIMIEHASGNVKLVDFGIAKLLKPTERGGTQIGTPGYAPPEQYQGMATRESDIYGLAATLHHLLTGRDPAEQPPFSFPLAKDVNPKISGRTSAALQKALQMKSEDRFRSITEFRAALRPLASFDAARSQPTRALTPPVRSAAPTRPVAPSRPVPAPIPAAPIAPLSPTTRLAKRFVRGVATLTVAGAVATALFLSAPAWIPLIPSWGQPGVITPPNVNPPTVPMELISFETEVEFDAPVNATSLEIRDAWRKAYQEQVIKKYSSAARISSNVPPSLVGGEPELIPGTNGVNHYRATVFGRVSVPASTPK